MKFYLKVFIIFFVLLYSTTGTEKSNGVNDYVKKNVIFGLPEKENIDFYIFRKQYLINYNIQLNTTNFVLYSLNKNDYGEVKRYAGTFIYDTLISKLKLKNKISHDDYTNSGYDRGHLLRSKERTSTTNDNLTTFYMTNIVPQTSDVNSGVWYTLEVYCEELVKNNKELYVVAGTIFSKNKKYYKNLIIPDTLYKIILINNNKSNKLYLKNIKVIAVKIPNIKGLRKTNWKKYICTVQEIENSTGYDFYPLLSKKNQKKLECSLFIK